MNFGPKKRSETSEKPSRNDPRVNFRFRFRKVVNLESELGVQFGPVQVRKLMEYSPLRPSSSLTATAGFSANTLCSLSFLLAVPLPFPALGFSPSSATPTPEPLRISSKDTTDATLDNKWHLNDLGAMGTNRYTLNTSPLEISTENHYAIEDRAFGKRLHHVCCVNFGKSWTRDAFEFVNGDYVTTRTMSVEAEAMWRELGDSDACIYAIAGIVRSHAGARGLR
ncbi:hypothetical protein B0H13DRAFT_1897496 [Mycena leptocephala]|nr:hypothetical protein B0H13DRAFT_1897496 [Mycena leptocephala]